MVNPTPPTDTWRSRLPSAANKPFAPSAERNTAPILAVLREVLTDVRSVLEVGSGTGQHAVAFAAALPHLHWTTADQRQHHDGIRAWIEDAGLPNIDGPLPLAIGADPFPEGPFDAVYTANTLHYMPWSAVEALMAAMRGLLRPAGLLVVYGPFREGVNSSARMTKTLMRACVLARPTEACVMWRPWRRWRRPQACSASPPIKCRPITAA